MIEQEIETLHTARAGSQKACKLGEQAFGREEEGARRLDRRRQLQTRLELIRWRKEPAWLGRAPKRLVQLLE